MKVNVDDSPKLQQRFNVMAIPTLMVLRRGAVPARACVPGWRRSSGLAGLGMRPRRAAGKL